MTRLLLIIAATLITSGLVAMAPQRSQPGDLIVAVSPTPFPPATQTPWVIEVERTVVVTATPDYAPTSTPAPRFALWEAHHVRITIGEVTIEFDPVHYTPAFDEDFDTPAGALWMDDNRNTGVWLHSGPNSVATPLQMAVEIGPNGNRQDLYSVNTLIDQLPGLPVAVDLDGVVWNMRLLKVGRFPAWDVPFLEANYMQVDKILGGEPVTGGLILWHCTRAAAGEIENNIRTTEGGETYHDGWDFGRIIWVIGP
jgi:hypothetical protein